MLYKNIINKIFTNDEYNEKKILNCFFCQKNDIVPADIKKLDRVKIFSLRKINNEFKIYSENEEIIDWMYCDAIFIDNYYINSLMDIAAYLKPKSKIVILFNNLISEDSFTNLLNGNWHNCGYNTEDYFSCNYLEEKLLMAEFIKIRFYAVTDNELLCMDETENRFSKKCAVTAQYLPIKKYIISRVLLYIYRLNNNICIDDTKKELQELVKMDFIEKEKLFELINKNTVEPKKIIKFLNA